MDTKYLVIKGNAGLGNRLLCAISGILYGQLTGRTTIIDWSDGAYGENDDNVFPIYFEYECKVTTNMLSNVIDIEPKIWTNQIHRSASEMITQYYPNNHSSIFIHRKLSVDVRRLDYQQTVIVFWNYLHRICQLYPHLCEYMPEISGMSIHNILSQATKKFIKLRPDIQDRINIFKKRYFDNYVIGLHIRYSDRKTNLDLYHKKLEPIINKYPDAKIFLATDSKDILEHYMHQYRNVISTPKWYPDNMDSMHQNASCEDRLENGKEALVDMYLLANCNYLIYSSRSTFSLLSHMLSNLKKEQVVDLDRYNPVLWFKRNLRNIIP